MIKNVETPTANGQLTNKFQLPTICVCVVGVGVKNEGAASCPGALRQATDVSRLQRLLGIL